MNNGTKRLGTLAAIAAGGLVLVACGTPAGPSAAVPTVAVDPAGGQSSAVAPVQPGASAPAPAVGAPVAGAPTSIDGQYDVAAGGAALVRMEVAGAALTVLENTPADGWQLVEDDRDVDEAQLTYLRGADVVELDADIDDGRFETDLQMESFPVAGPVTYQVADAGNVTIEVVNNRVMLVGQEAAPGWIATVDERELSDGEVEIRFRSEATPGAVSDFDAQIDDGRLDVDIDTTTGWGR